MDLQPSNGTHLDQRDEEGVEVPKQKIFQKLASLERVGYGDSRLLLHSLSRRYEPVAIRSLEVLQDLVEAKRLITARRDHMLDVCRTEVIGFVLHQSSEQAYSSSLLGSFACFPRTPSG